MLKKLTTKFRTSLLIPAATIVVGGIAGAILASIFLSGSNTSDNAKDTIADSSPAETSQVVTAEALPSQPERQEADVAVAAYAVPKAENLQELTKTVSVGKGDTLMKVLTRAGADRTESHEAISALNKIFDPRSLKIGQDVPKGEFADE